MQNNSQQVKPQQAPKILIDTKDKCQQLAVSIEDRIGKMKGVVELKVKLV